MASLKWFPDNFHNPWCWKIPENKTKKHIPEDQALRNHLKLVGWTHFQQKVLEHLLKWTVLIYIRATISDSLCVSHYQRAASCWALFWTLSLSMLKSFNEVDIAVIPLQGIFRLRILSWSIHKSVEGMGFGLRLSPSLAPYNHPILFLSVLIVQINEIHWYFCTQCLQCALMTSAYLPPAFPLCARSLVPPGPYEPLFEFRVIVFLPSVSFSFFVPCVRNGTTYLTLWVWLVCSPCYLQEPWAWCYNPQPSTLCCCHCRCPPGRLHTMSSGSFNLHFSWWLVMLICILHFMSFFHLSIGWFIDV